MTFLQSLFTSQSKKQRKAKKQRQIIKVRNEINNHSKTLKKYKNRKSPPYPANGVNCGKKMIGNDGNMYISTQNKNYTCIWKKYKR